MSKNLDRKLVKQLTDKSPSEFIEVKELTASSQDLNEVCTAIQTLNLCIK